MEGVIPEEGVGYDLDVIWVYKGHEDNESVQKVIDYVGSEAGMESAGEHRSMVTKPGVEGTVGDTEPNLIDYDERSEERRVGKESRYRCRYSGWKMKR